MNRILACCLLTTALLAGCQESMEERAARDARELSEKKCPMPLDSEGMVILDYVEFDIPTLTWKESLLLNLADSSEVDADKMKSLLLDELKNTPSYKPYMDNGYRFRYVYCRTTAPADTLADITLTDNDYR